MTNIIGNMFSFLMPTWYFDKNDESSEFMRKFQNYAFTGALVCLCSCVPSILLMKTKPNVPPSISAQTQREYNYSIKESIKQLFDNKCFVCILISYSTIFGFYVLYFVTANNYYTVFGIESKTISYLICLSNFTGIIGSLIFSYLVDRVRYYKKLFVTFNSIIVIIFFYMMIYLETYFSKDNIIILYICFGLYGFCLIPLYSITLDFVCELTYPIGESFSIGILRAAGQVVGFLSSFFIDLFLENLSEYKYVTNVFCITLFIISLISLILLKGDYN